MQQQNHTTHYIPIFTILTTSKLLKLIFNSSIYFNSLFAYYNYYYFLYTLYHKIISFKFYF